MTQGAQAVVAIPATPPIYSLLVAADIGEPVGDDGQPVRWQRGVEWSPELIGGGNVGVVDCDGSSDMDTNENLPIQTWLPFAVYATDKCSTIGWKARDYEGRATRQLNAVQSYLIAKELQHGGLGSDNVTLDDAVSISPSPAAIVNALAELEGAIGDVLRGRRAMIHAPVQLFTMMKANNLIFQAGQKWITAIGSIVAADAGYDGVNLYATSLPLLTLGTLNLVPGSLEQARAQATDKATNLTTIYAERLALVRLDSTLDDTPGDAMMQIEVNVDPWSTSA